MCRGCDLDSSEIDKGVLLFDERNDNLLRARKRRLRFALRILSVFLFVSSAFIITVLIGVIQVENGGLWQTSNLVLGMILIFAVAVMSFMASRGNEHIIVFQNGIELCRFSGLLLKSDFFPFDSISRAYTNLLDSRGNKIEHMILELTGHDKESYLFIDNRDLVDKSKFLELVSRRVSIDNESVKAYKLTKRLRAGRASRPP